MIHPRRPVGAGWGLVARRRARGAVLTAAALALGTACLSRPALVPQTFSIDPPAIRETRRAPDAVVVSLRRVDVAAQFDGKPLVYRTGDHRLERDPYANLAAPPGDMLTEAIRAYLRNASFVRDVVEPGGEPPDLVVEVDAKELSGDLATPGDAAAILILDFRVSPARATGGPMAPAFDKEYSRRARLPRRTAEAIVAAWNDELAQIMDEVLRDLAAALARGRAPGSRRGVAGRAFGLSAGGRSAAP